MNPLDAIRQRLINTMRKSVLTCGHLLHTVTQAQATTLHDGPGGWTVLEVLCHLRDYDVIFHERAVMMLTQETPALPAYDHMALAVERNYNAQGLGTVYAHLAESRARFADFFAALTPEEWERAGVHPERGHFSMTDAALQVVTHDADHLEQITRILTQR
jgi:hypothetical protein